MRIQMDGTSESNFSGRFKAFCLLGISHIFKTLAPKFSWCKIQCEINISRPVKFLISFDNNPDKPTFILDMARAPTVLVPTIFSIGIFNTFRTVKRIRTGGLDDEDETLIPSSKYDATSNVALISTNTSPERFVVMKYVAKSGCEQCSISLISENHEFLDATDT
ncbi:uncharacterized protein LOC143363646 [Halictus rubicundus]|uniref:uncharacterized protein LOC143363646 n=1 Tax=Halictus rubicundus TaxID=77578 RepID=UPI004036DA75